MEPRHKQNRIDRQPSLIRGGKALLFERLCSGPGPGDSDTWRPENQPFRAYELQALVASVLREMRCLLNTRIPEAVGQSDENSQTIINYGLPDFSVLNAASPADREKLATLIELKIAAFEPRLREVRIMLDPDPLNRCNLIGTMRGVLHTNSFSEPVSFPVLLGNSGVTVEQTGTPQFDYASGR